MLQRLFPPSIDNAYRGHRAAFGCLALLVLMKGAMGLNSIFNGRTVASVADGIPLDTFTPAGAQTVVSLFAIWGLCQCLYGLLGILAWARYRAMIPFVFALFLVEHLGRKLILHFLPIARAANAPASLVNGVLLALMALGLVLSLWNPRKEA